MLFNDRDLELQADRIERLALQALGEVGAEAVGEVGGHEVERGIWAELSDESRGVLLSPGTFSDECGDSRPTDRLLIRHVAMRVLGEGRAGDLGSAFDAEGGGPDAAIWRVVLELEAVRLGRVEVESEALPLVESLLSVSTTDEPMASVAQSAATTIEVWTETELCGLHALWWCYALRSSSVLGDRIDRAKRWLLQNIQPDNATNRPWALPVFLIAAAEEQDGDSALFAGQLIHNALMNTLGLGRGTGAGVPDRLSAWILLDTAMAIRFWARAGR